MAKSITKTPLSIAFIALSAVSLCSLASPCSNAQNLTARPVELALNAGEKTIMVTPDAMRTRTIDQLLHDLDHKDPAARSTAAYYLGELGKRASQAVSKLCQIATKDQSKWARRSAAKALGKVGTKEAISGLMLAAKDRDPWVSHSARNALESLGTSARFRLSASPRYGEPSDTILFRAQGNSVWRESQPRNNLP